MASNLDECGYDEFFTTEVPDELKCVICHLVLREPVQIMTCGHRFCSPCFSRMKVNAEGTNTELSCPVDREAVLHGHVFPDRAVSRTIGNLKVHCGNFDQGCSWVDDLRDLKDHEESCQFKIVAGLEEMSVKGGRDEEIDAVIKRILMRLQTCENDALKKDKALSNMRFIVDELKQDNIVKDQEIQMLKLCIAELKSDVKTKDDKIRELYELIDVPHEVLLPTKHVSEQNRQNSKKLRSSSFTIESQMKELTQNEVLKDQIETIRRDVEKKREQNYMKIDENNQSIQDLKRDVENLECVLYAQQNLIEKGIIKFDWVMQDFLHMFCIGADVYSPIFHPMVGGYSFQLYVKWTGPDKNEMGLYLRLHRGRTPHQFLQDFNYEFALTIHGKDGVTQECHFDETDIRKFKQGFTIKKGSNSPDADAGSTILTAPYDDFIINNSLLVTLTVHI